MFQYQEKLNKQIDATRTESAIIGNRFSIQNFPLGILGLYVKYLRANFPPPLTMDII